MSRTIGDPRYALIGLGSEASFESKALISIYGSDIINFDVLSLLIATGRYKRINPLEYQKISEDELRNAEQIAGKIFIQHSANPKDIARIINALNLIESYSVNVPQITKFKSWWEDRAKALKSIIGFPEGSHGIIAPTADEWSDFLSKMRECTEFNDEVFESFTAKFNELESQAVLASVTEDLVERTRIIGLALNQAVLPIEACILIGARKVDFKAASRLAIRKKLIIENERHEARVKGALWNVSPPLDPTGRDFWRCQRQFFSEWAEITVPLEMSKSGLRECIRKLTGREPRLVHVDRAADIVGVSIRS
jgi:hypothetical protein